MRTKLSKLIGGVALLLAPHANAIETTVKADATAVSKMTGVIQVEGDLVKRSSGGHDTLLVDDKTGRILVTTQFAWAEGKHEFDNDRVENLTIMYDGYAADGEKFDLKIVIAPVIFGENNFADAVPLSLANSVKVQSLKDRKGLSSLQGRVSVARNGFSMQVNGLEDKKTVTNFTIEKATFDPNNGRAWDLTLSFSGTSPKGQFSGHAVLVVTDPDYEYPPAGWSYLSLPEPMWAANFRFPGFIFPMTKLENGSWICEAYAEDYARWFWFGKGNTMQQAAYNALMKCDPLFKVGEPEESCYIPTAHCQYWLDPAAR